MTEHRFVKVGDMIVNLDHLAEVLIDNRPDGGLSVKLNMAHLHRGLGVDRAAGFHIDLHGEEARVFLEHMRTISHDLGSAAADPARGERS